MADQQIAGPGTGAGQVSEPWGLAVDHSSGRLYVAERKDNRVSVFDSEGHFLKAFGWGVADGATQALQTCTATCHPGISGAGKGQFNKPTAIAVDSTTHLVYVVDSGNARVQEFDEEGNFILTFGGEVNKTTNGDVCTAASGDVCGAGVAGGGEGELTASASVSIEPSGIVYVVDNVGGSQPFENRLQKFEPSGSVIPPAHVLFEGGAASAAAVDSAGNVWVSNELPGGLAIREYNAAGTKLNEIPGLTLFRALAIDSSDDIFAFQAQNEEASNIVEFDSAGEALRRFGYGSFRSSSFTEGLAIHRSAGIDDGVYASRPNGGVELIDFPPPGPEIFPAPCSAPLETLGNTHAALSARVNPEGKATSVRFEYVNEESFESEGGWSSSEVKESEEASIGDDFDLHKASVEVEGLEPSTEYRCRAVASNEDAPAGITGEEGAFTTRPPFEITSMSVADVSADSATLRATVNPLGIAATAHFEYVEEGQGFEGATATPEVDLGEGEAGVDMSVAIEGLSPATAYRYRVVVTDSFRPSGEAGPEEPFHTFAATAALPDFRAYELVSPARKQNAEVGVPRPAGGLSLAANVRIQAAGADGESVTYTSFTSFAEPQGAPGTSQYLSRRGPSGWITENITPPGNQLNFAVPPYTGFTPSLGKSYELVDEPPLTPDALEGFPNLYERDSATGALRALTTVEPPEGQRFCPSYAGTSADGEVIFAANASFTPDAPLVPAGSKFSRNLYELAPGGTLSLVSVLPGGAAATPTPKTAFGPAGRECEGGQTETGLKMLKGAISEDGSRIFWTYVPSESESRLYARVNGTETLQLDAAQGGPESGGGKFLRASADGLVVIFSDTKRLTADANASGADLYRYDFQASPGERLTDLSGEALTPGAEAAGVQGLVGASEDGSAVYFVATGVLSGEEENERGQKAESGKPNLYLWRAGEGASPTFVATLTTSGESKDSGDWEATPVAQTAQASADGGELAFIATEGLTDYDNRREGGAGCKVEVGGEEEFEGSDPRCQEAYLYDAESGQLHCVSCNPSGSRPLGPTFLPTWSNPFAQPRFLSENGSRVFFSSWDRLSLADESARPDVYEYERSGVGTCTSQSAEFREAAGGCIYLISSGQSEDSSFLLDASADGRDLFFSTRGALLGADDNDNYDVYDARSDGGFREVPQPPVCESAEACKDPLPPPPAVPSPGTPSFSGDEKPPTHKKSHKHHRKKKHKHRRGGGRR
jgi:hypothetical protein